MFEALVVTLREGIEAALMVGIIAAFLKKQGAERYLGMVWVGIATAAAASLAGAFLLYRAAVNEEVFEGLLYLASAVLVGTFLVWMWRHSHEISGKMKGSLTRILERERAGSVAAGLFLFTFLMVFREGVETVLFLSAISLTTSGLAALLGALAGLAAAIVFGVLFVRGSLRVDLGRFFTVTGIALLIFLVQLLLNGYHELAEAGWLPANETSMATVGPLVKNELFFIVAVLALPLLLLLVPGKERRTDGAPAATPSPVPPSESGAAAYSSGAAARLERAASRRQGRARTLGGALGIAIVAALGLGFVYSRPPAALSPAAMVAPGPDGKVRIPLSTFRAAPEKLQRFQVEIEGRPVRFFAVPLDKEAKKVVAGFDACEICGPRGYYQEGSSLFCLHCNSAIYPPSVGQPGGCNPVPLPMRVEGDAVVFAAPDLARGLPMFAGVGGAPAAHGMAHGS